MTFQKSFYFMVAGICAVVLVGMAGVSYKHSHDIENAKVVFTDEKLNIVKDEQSKIEKRFTYFYQALRTMSLLPSIRNNTQTSHVISSDTHATLQQVYNNAYENVKMSEFYLEPKIFDPDKIDPQTKKLQEPYLTMDKFIVGNQGTDKKDEEDPTKPKLEEVEIFEYRLEKQQIDYFIKKYPTENTFPPLQVPALMGPAVITCDNSEFTLENFKSHDNSNRLGFVYTVPAYNNAGELNGAVSGVLRTKVLLDSMQAKNFMLYNPIYQYQNGNQPAPWLENSVPYFKMAKVNPNLIVSGTVTLNFKEENPFQLWYAFDDAEFWARSDVKAINQFYFFSLAFLAILGIASIVKLRSTLNEKRILEEKIEERTKSLMEKTKTIRNILNNVTYGLFLCDEKLQIQNGFSSCCEKLFQLTSAEFATKKLTEVLRLSQRESEFYETLYEQVYENIGPQEVTIGQLPNRFSIENKTIALNASIIWDEKKNVESVLYSAIDITELAKAEKTIIETRSLIKILKSKSRFKSFLSTTIENIELMKLASQNPIEMSKVRKNLHTIKGNFGVFQLSEMAEMIHKIEDIEIIELKHIEQIEKNLKEFLNKNFSILGIEYDKNAMEDLQINESDLNKIETLLSSSIKTFDEFKLQTFSFFNKLRMKPIEKILGPIEEYCAQLASRFGKKITLEITGQQILIPEYMYDIVGNLVHLIRNSIDYGIELPSQRVKLGKPKNGIIKIIFLEDNDNYTIKTLDDGQGINIPLLVKKAVEIGEITPSNAQSLTQQAALQLIYKTGVSTAEKITDVSGRGIGMSAVQDAVLKVGGIISIESEKFKGTQFTMQIPKKLLP